MDILTHKQDQLNKTNIFCSNSKILTFSHLKYVGLLLMEKKFKNFSTLLPPLNQTNYIILERIIKWDQLCKLRKSISNTI
jgi:hypothetical protein